MSLYQEANRNSVGVIGQGFATLTRVIFSEAKTP